MERSINVITDAKFVGESFEGRLRPLTIFFEDGLVLVADVNVHPHLCVNVVHVSIHG